MKKLVFSFVSFLFFHSLIFLEAQSKGAIIIASLEGDVSIVNNETQTPVAADQVKPGGLIFDGHTVKTGPTAKVVLLMSNGTVSTIKSNSTVNIKEFTQEKFDPTKKKLSEMKGEPSSSKTEIDLEMGDMILDVKKLNKRSSFNVQSPVGTAGIRGTIPYFQVTKGNDGGFQQVTSMLKGEIAFTPKGANIPTLLGPGQSLSIGVGPNGLLLPPTLGKVPQSILTSIEAEIEASGGITGVTSADDSSAPESGNEVMDEEAPSEEELNEADDSRGAAAKGVDDNGSTEAVALEKADLIDLDDPEQIKKVDIYVEATVGASEMLSEKQASEENGGRRNSVDGSKGSDAFISDLVGNLDDTVNVIDEQEKLGVKSSDLLKDTLENAENAPITNDNMQKVKNAGVEDSTALKSLISSPANSDEAAEFIDEALKADPTEGSSSAVTKLGAVARSASVADKMKEAKDEGIDPDTIIDSAVAVADLEIQAEKQQAELISSGPEIDPALISLINNASDEAAINAVLEGKENESFYDKLSQLGESRLRALELQNNKTKISTTIKAADSRNKNIEKKRQEAEQLKGGIPADVITALEAADISSSDKVIALKDQYEELYKSEVTTLESISNYIDKLKSAYDLENKDLTSFVEDVNTLETIFTATADNEDFDISDSLIQIEEVAETFELLQSDGEEIDLEAAANLAQNANEIQESKKLLTVAKDEGIDLKTLAKKDIKEQKAINKAVDDQKKSVEKQRLEREQLAGALSQELRATLDAADVSTDELVQAYKDDYATDPLVASIEDYLDARRKAYKLENADLSKLAETSQTLAVLYESTEGNEDFDISDSLAEIEAVQETFQLLSEDGEIDINNFDIDAAANIASNAADIEESKKAIKLAKDAGIDATEIAKKDVDEQKAINKVAEKLEAAGGADAAKNFLASGAADDALQYEKALEDDPDLAGTIATAVTDVSDGNSESGPSVDLKARIEEKVKDSAKGKLVAEYQDNETYSSIIEENEARAQDLSYALSFVEKESAQEKALFANIDKLDAIISLGSRFKDDEEKLAAVFDNLDHANALNELVTEFKNQPSRIDLILENPELSPAVLSAYKDFSSTGSNGLIRDLFADSASMKETLSNDGINKLRQKYPQYEKELNNYSDRAGEIKSLLEQFEGDQEREQFILTNLEDFDTVRGLSARFQGSEEKLNTIFTYEGELSDLKKVSDDIKKANVIGGQDFLFDNLDRIEVLGQEVNQIETFIGLDGYYENKAESMDIVYANPTKAGQLLFLADELKGQADDLLANVDQLDVIEGLFGVYKKEDGSANAESMGVVFANSQKAGQLLGLAKDLEGQADDLLANVDQLDVIEGLAGEYNNDADKMGVVFANSQKAGQLLGLAKDLEGQADDLLANVDQLDVIEGLAGEYSNDADKMGVVFANSQKAGQLLGLAKDLEGQADNLLANVDQLDVIEGLAVEYSNDAEKMGVVFSNPDKASRILDISKKFSTKHEEILSAVDDLADVEALANRFENDADKIETLFDNVDRVADISTLADKFDEAASNGVEVKPEDVLDNLDYLDDVLALDQEFEGEDGKLMNLYLNPEKAGSLLGLMDRYDEKAEDLIFNLDSLDSILVMESKLDGNAENMDIILANPEKSNDLKNLADKLPGKEGALLDNIDQLDVIGELTETFNADSDKMDIVFENSSSASKLRNLSKDLPNNTDDLLANIDQLDVVEDLVDDFNADPEKMLVVFKNPSKAKTLRDLIDDPSFEGQKDDLLSNIDNVDNFKREPRLLGFKKNHPKFFEMLEDVTEDLNIKPEDVEFDLLTQLVELSLTRDELHKVLTDLNIGPDSDGPSDQPPSDEGLDEEALAVTLLESHDFSGEIPSDLVISENQIRASSLFQETLDVFDALSEMDGPSSYTESSSSNTELPMGIIGGVNLKIGTGNYDLSDLGFLSYAFAASDSLKIDGQLSFTSTNSVDELLFISAGTLELVQGSFIDFSGDSLGIGSFDSIEIIDVSLHSEGEIGVRSLDSIVINNSDFATRGSGADHIHLIAASQLAVDNLILSEQVRQITMEAMTINLSNLNFPAGSSVSLKSAYGGVDGVYPNFGSISAGRVNFIKNIRYNSNLINSRSTFDTFGSNISIGVLSN